MAGLSGAVVESPTAVPAFPGSTQTLRDAPTRVASMAEFVVLKLMPKARGP